ncbi:MAG: hypothetical protein ACKPJF_09355 [Dolichospermum sp.]
MNSKNNSEKINEYYTLSYDQQYRYLCDESGCKQCRKCGFWEMTLTDGICADCEYAIDEEIRKLDENW